MYLYGIYKCVRLVSEIKPRIKFEIVIYSDRTIMKIIKTYSHMNGEEYLLLRKPKVFAEIRKFIARVNYAAPVNEVVTHRNIGIGSNLLHDSLRKSFREKGWKESRCYCYRGKNHFQDIAGLPLHEQRKFLERAGLRKPIKAFMRMGLVKDRVAVETPFRIGAQHSALLKQLLFYSGDVIDVGVEILPVKARTEDPNGGRMMSTGVAYYEGEVYNVLRHGRASPPVPLFIIGIAP